MPLLDKYLDPAESFGELFFGLVMALSFTLGASVIGQDEPEQASTILLAAIGCNIAWGVIDAAMFLMGRIYDRRRAARLLRMAMNAGAEGTREELLKELLEQRFELTPQDRTSALDDLARSLGVLLAQRQVRRVGPTGEDFAAAALVCALVAACALWAALPLLFFADQLIVMRVSNAISVCALFFIGYRWARHTDVMPLRTGLITASLGVILVLIAIALGG